ncbi:DUF916 domain-containing protein [Enterococcus faecalis]|uniref:DUF916 domain-containing protein n=1 Tax=Enterococcus faecalis TaxID=1351 RepID=UPI0034CF9A74
MRKISIKKLMLKVILSSFILILWGVSVMPISVNSESNAKQLSYEVKPLFENQKNDQVLDYFYFETVPNEQKKISIEIKNNANEKQTFNVEFNRANTNGNGMIDYSLNKKIKDSEGTNKIDIQQLVNNPKQKVIVEANSSKIVTFYLKLPDYSYEGILLGGIYITVDNNKGLERDKQKDGIKLEPSLAYAIAVMIQEEIPYKGGSQLDVDSLSINEKDNQSVLRIDMSNPKPNILNKVNMNIKIYKEGENTVYSEITKDNMNFAPEDWFSLEIPWSKKELRKGRYVAKLEFISGKDKWLFEKKFFITQKEVNKIEDKLVLQDKYTNVKLLIYLLTLVLIILSIIVVLLILNRKKTKDG